MRRATKAAAVTVVGLLVGAANAHAGLEVKSGPLTYVSFKAQADPNAAGTGNLGCPAGSRSAGVGGGIGGTNEGRHISELRLFDGGDLGPTPDDGALINIFNGSGGTPNVKLTAICLNAGENQISYSLEGGTIPAATNGTDPEIPADCEAETKVIGGGAAIEGSPALTAIRDTYPGTSGWDGAVRKGVTPEDRDYSTQAACLPRELRTIKVRKTQASVGSEKTKTVSVNCPKGYRASGGGSDAGNTMEYFASAPTDGGDADKAPDDGWQVRVINVSNQREDISARVVCLGGRK